MAGTSPRFASRGAASSREVSPFDARTPNEVESLKVAVPRGLKFAPASKRIGRLVASGPSREVPTKTYEVTVLPNGRTKKARELIREKAHLDSDLEYDLKRSASGDLGGLVDVERSACRAERVKRLETTRHFPALVTPRLVPSYRLRSAGQASVRQADLIQTGDRATGGACTAASSSASPRGGGGVQSTSLRAPTVSSQRKHQLKRSMGESSQQSFLPSGPQAEELICDRGPGLFEDHYDSAKSVALQELQCSQSRWMSNRPILPACSSRAKVLCDPGNLEREAETAELRERGRQHNQDMKYDHMRKLQKYQRDTPSPFDMMQTFRSRSRYSPRPTQQEVALDPVPEALDTSHLLLYARLNKGQQSSPISTMAS